MPTFAPVYDSARGLLWNYSDENIKNIFKQTGKKVVNYVEEASPRISIEDNTKANHFQLINFIKKFNKEYEIIVNELASTEKEENVLNMLNREIFPLFIKERAELITVIIKTRFKKIRDL